MEQNRPTGRQLTREQVARAHELIKPFIHLTPVSSSATLSALASTPQTSEALAGTDYEGQPPAKPKIQLFFKCENYQKIGAFKARGAFHALSRLLPGQLEDGVCTHSSGNHAQALALAARTKGVAAHIVMPSISQPAKIAATQGYGANVYFSGSTSSEREEVLKEVMEKTGARFVPPYDHVDIILGQGTTGLEFESQVKEKIRQWKTEGAEKEGFGWRSREAETTRLGKLDRNESAGEFRAPGVSSEGLDAVVVPCGGGGLLSGVATALHGTGTLVFAAEPMYQGANDLERGLAASPPSRIETVSTLTIADGLRTPVGKIPWSVISDKSKVRGAYSVTEEQIKKAMKLLLERCKIMVEPSAAVGLAVVLFNESFRKMVEKETANGAAWNIGVILTGGNTTVEAIAAIYKEDSERSRTEEREQAQLGLDGEKQAENVAG